MPAAGTCALLDERFLVLESLGRGGMARVFRCFDRTEQRFVAIKVLDGRERPGPSHPLALEFETWHRLSHPNIVRAYELGCAREGPFPVATPYLVLECFPGRPAHRVLAARDPDNSAIESFASRVLSALDHVHRSGIVHRDLKPSNVLVCRARGGHHGVKLIDFGLAARIGERREPGRISGSIPYIAPEVVLGQPLDGRADLYGLGILLYYLSTGVMPSPRRDADSVIRWHLRGAQPDPRRVAPGVSERLARLILSLTARNRDDRPATASEAIAILGAAPPGSAKPRARLARPTAELAALRLAMDAARLGAQRVMRVAAGWTDSRTLLREAGILAQTHGLTICRIAPSPRNEIADLTRAIVRLILARGEAGKAVAERHRLRRVLPMDFLGSIPLWDRDHRAQDDVAPAAHRLASFLLDLASGGPLVLCVDLGVTRAPLTRAIVDLVETAAGADRWIAPRRGGLLVVVRDGAGRYEHPLVEPSFTQT